MQFTKPFAIALALAFGAVTFASSADANHRRYHHGYHHHHHGGAAAAGIFGFAAGAIVGSSLAHPYYYRPAPVYVAPRRVYQPRPVYVAVTPWTPGWYTYCGNRYRSFNRQTGYFLGYDGNYHFCR